MEYLSKYLPHFLSLSAMNGQNHQGQQLLWLVRLRFISILIQIPLSYVGFSYGYLDFQTLPIFNLILITAFIYNSFLYRSIMSGNQSHSSENYLSWQICLELLIFTLFLYLSGGSNNPLYSIYFVLAIMGGIFSVGSGPQFLVLLILSVTFIQIYPALESSYAWDAIFNYQTLPYLISQISIPTIAFFISRSFGAVLKEGQDKLLNLALHNERMERLKVLGALSAGFSHEFASPLQAAQLRLKRAQRESTSSTNELTECEEALNECERILRKMNASILDFNESDLEIVDLKSFVSLLLNEWRQDNHEIRINEKIDPYQIKIHPLNLAQALINIFDNAAESMSFKGEINIYTKASHSLVELYIEDNGSGIPRTVFSHLGEPFNTTKANGTGLGLYSSILTMNSIGGSLHLLNLPEKGARIVLNFPLGEIL